MDVNNGNEEDERERLWKRLQELEKKEKENLDSQRKLLEEEKAAMANVNAEPSDIITINVGGERMIQCHRSTLCLAEGSVLSSMFSGRWEDAVARDKDGNVFFDHDPDLIVLIINYLRTKSLDATFTLEIPSKKRRELFILLKYFGLTDFFIGSGNINLAGIQFSQISNNVTINHGQGVASMTYTYVDDDNSDIEHYWVSCKLPTQRALCYWKVYINPTDYCFYAGVIGSSNPSNERSFRDQTSYGWADRDQVFIAGKDHAGHGGWSEFSEGETLVFCLKDTKLMMYSMIKDRVFVINDLSIPNEETYIHFNFTYPGQTVSLSEASFNERAALESKISN